MKKLMPFKQQMRAMLPSMLVCASLIGVGLSGMTFAEDKTVEIQPGNVLGKIVAEHYPGYANRQAIMQEILKRNPTAFSSQNVNSLIVGKTLKLPDAKDIPDLKPPVPKAVGGSDPATQKKITELETQVTELNDTVALLKEENAGLQEMVKGSVEAPATTTTGTDELQKQLDAAKQSLQEAETAKRTLEEQVASAKHDNETLQNDLQQIRAAAAIAESNASSAGSLPWILLGLLALLTLPLIWLLRRKREPAPLVVGKAAAIPAVAVAEVPAVLTTTPDVLPSTTGDTIEAAVVAVEENADVSLKLDIARAYLDLRDSAAAADILQDVVAEGGERQRQEAREILSFIT